MRPSASTCARNLKYAVADTSAGAFNQVHTRIRVQSYEIFFIYIIFKAGFSGQSKKNVK